MRVDFYHLAEQPVERVLPRIAERVLAEGGRLLVVVDDEGLAKRLDEALWDYAPESFLPHGRAGAGDEPRQLVLIGPDLESANGARLVALADGVWRDEALAFERAFHLFDDAALPAARAAWKALAARDDIERCFWKQQNGRWTRAG